MGLKGILQAMNKHWKKPEVKKKKYEALHDHFAQIVKDYQEEQGKLFLRLICNNSYLLQGFM